MPFTNTVSLMNSLWSCRRIGVFFVKVCAREREKRKCVARCRVCLFFCFLPHEIKESHDALRQCPNLTLAYSLRTIIGEKPNEGMPNFRKKTASVLHTRREWHE